jgi:LPXTG-motif cell wall-anchored protein
LAYFDDCHCTWATTTRTVWHMDRHLVRRALGLAGLTVGLTAASLFGAAQASAAPACPDGSSDMIVVDDQGVTQTACVAQAAPLAVPAAVSTGSGQSRQRTLVADSALPQTGTGTGEGLLLASALVAFGSAASLAARRKAA